MRQGNPDRWAGRGFQKGQAKSMKLISRPENNNKHQLGPFRSYVDLFVQRIPRYAVKKSRSWTTKNKPLSDRPVKAHLAGQYAVATLAQWYPSFAVIDIDDRPRGVVDEIRDKLGLEEKNSMLFSSESPDSFHLLLRPEYSSKPPTIRLLGNIFHNFCLQNGVEIYPQATRAIRLPFGPCQEPLDFEYLGLDTWEAKLFWFQKLDAFDLRGVRGQQYLLDLALPDKPAIPHLLEDNPAALFQHGLQAPSSRNYAQFKILYWLWRRNVPRETAQDMVWAWVRKRHNGFSKDIISHPSAVRKEIGRQAGCIYDHYDLARVYPDSTHNLVTGFISKHDVENVIRVARGSLPRMRFLFHLVKYCAPRRYRTFVNVHRDRLIEWGNNRTYGKYLREFEEQGILTRGRSYQPGVFSKAIKMVWPFKSSSDAVLYDGRSVEDFEGTVRLVFTPEEFRVLIRNAGADRGWSFKMIRKIWKEPPKSGG